MLIDKFNLSSERTHVLLDMPIEKGNKKLGSDINILTYRNETRSLSSMSGIVSGVEDGFRNQIQRLRVLVHPETESVIEHSESRDLAVFEIMAILRTLIYR
jgi:hypothetical protein